MSNWKASLPGNSCLNFRITWLHCARAVAVEGLLYAYAYRISWFDFQHRHEPLFSKRPHRLGGQPRLLGPFPLEKYTPITHLHHLSRLRIRGAIHHPPPRDTVYKPTYFNTQTNLPWYCRYDTQSRVTEKSVPDVSTRLDQITDCRGVKFQKGNLN